MVTMSQSRDSEPVQPAEWSAHAACITAYPDSAEAWGDELHNARNEFEVFVRALCQHGEESVWLLCRPGSMGRSQLADLTDAANAGSSHNKGRVHFLDVPYGDVWLRDIAPIFLKPAPQVATFAFNGWGGKFVYEHDNQVAARLCRRLGLVGTALPLVTEGGALESDGQGTFMSTLCCLQNDNRNPGLSLIQIEGVLGEGVGAKKVLWLDAGLQNDHTDGHIDNVARFVAPGEVLCMRPNGEDDPNRELLLTVEATLRGFTDAHDRALRVHTLPSPGRVLGADGEVAPASYMNFYIANKAVVVPGYGLDDGGRARDAAAVAVLTGLFPGRKVVSCPSRSILSGGGSFHCITQQVPMGFAELSTMVNP